ncbi:MAG: CpaD family pilus assembly lipoprotein, partial [Sphingobium sp.]
MSHSATTTRAGRNTLRPMLRATGVALTALLALSSPALAGKKKTPVNRGLESVNQPVVQRTDFTFDLIPDGYNRLSRDEAKRMIDWFDAIQLGYGDRVAIADDHYARPGVATAVSDVLGHYGLLLADEAPRTAGEAPSGAVRIVVSRSTASVPGCPKWGD